MNIYVDIDGTICNSTASYYDSEPIKENIAKINKLYDEGHTITYWTARGSASGKDWKELTINQLVYWGCKFHHFNPVYKPSYDLLIDDKTKRIEEI